jgi:hypothetical protein
MARVTRAKPDDLLAEPAEPIQRELECGDPGEQPAQRREQRLADPGGRPLPLGYSRGLTLPERDLNAYFKFLRNGLACFRIDGTVGVASTPCPALREFTILYWE